MVNWLVGVDAGGTHSRALAMRAETGEQRRGEAEGANWTIHGPDLCRERIQRAVAAALPEGAVLASLCLCIAGYYPPDHREAVDAWTRETWPDMPVRAEPDVVGAWAGAFGGEPGIVLISGTGSICYGRNSRGEEARAGGWGPLFGDEGSAYALGIGCLRFLADMVDGVRPPNSFPDRVLQGWPELGSDLRSWLRGVYRCRWGREQVAALAPVVVEAADQGDLQARALVARAGNQLARLVKAVARRLHEAPLPLALQGGLLTSSERMVHFLMGPFEADAALILLREFPLSEADAEVIRLRESLLSPLEGALLLAAETWGGKAAVERVRERLQ